MERGRWREGGWKKKKKMCSGRERERARELERESEMTITLLTPVQHQLSISLPPLGKNLQRIIGCADPHPASPGRLANARLATATRSSKKAVWEHRSLWLPGE